MSRNPVNSRTMLIGLLVLLAALPASATRRKSPPKPPEPVYDRAREVVVRGAVEEVRSPTGRFNPLSVQQIVVLTESGPVLVQLAPSSYLKSKDFSCIKGDTVEVTGARAAIGEQQVVLARQVRAGDKTVTLRDADGRPVWLKTLQEVHRPGSSTQ
jgi:hypothetical protein